MVSKLCSLPQLRDIRELRIWFSRISAPVELCSRFVPPWLRWPGAKRNPVTLCFQPSDDPPPTKTRQPTTLQDSCLSAALSPQSKAHNRDQNPASTSSLFYNFPLTPTRKSICCAFPPPCVWPPVSPNKH